MAVSVYTRLESSGAAIVGVSADRNEGRRAMMVDASVITVRVAGARRLRFAT